MEVEDDLSEMEKNMSVEEKILFEERLENGYDLEIDEKYCKWKALKETAVAGGLAYARGYDNNYDCYCIHFFRKNNTHTKYKTADLSFECGSRFYN